MHNLHSENSYLIFRNYFLLNIFRRLIFKKVSLPLSLFIKNVMILFFISTFFHFSLIFLFHRFFLFPSFFLWFSLVVFSYCCYTYITLIIQFLINGDSNDSVSVKNIINPLVTKYLSFVEKVII